MPAVRNLRPGYTITYPNRDKASSKATKLVVVLILLVSVLLMLAVTIGGWSKLQGLVPVNFVLCLAYLIIAFYVWRWGRGLLPIAAAVAILLLIMAMIAGTGAASTSWFDRSSFGYSNAQTLFGGTGFSADTLGLLTVLLAPVQLLLIFFAMRAFGQGWNVEVEVPIDKLRERAGTGTPGESSAGGTGAPATA
ncbi:MAG TPA: hypothetical protein VG405_01720 [Solirubrobacteraceae bacterium]|jgi:hypothetical protein|nr:hypothetical protein [Solirubrobacteraceae bacterium]